MADTFCPASMCPLFAKDGSPWTSEKNCKCPQRAPASDESGDMIQDGGCLFWQGFGGSGCDGASGARFQVAEANQGLHVLQIGPVTMKTDQMTPREFDCPRAGDCQWQVESGDELCPPRLALSLGIDPKSCAY